MVIWTKASDAVPTVDQDDDFNCANNRSKRVLVKYSSTDTKVSGMSFGVYQSEHKFWTVEGFRGSVEVQYWSHLNEP
jgi:alpha-L-fucosidase